MAGQVMLSKQPEILELFQILENNGMTQEYQKVNFLVEYMESIERQFGQVLEELEKVNTQLMQIENRETHTAVSRITERTGDKMHEIANQLALVKNNLIHFAKDTTKLFQEKGTEALKVAVTKMKIPSILNALEKSFHNCMVYMNKNAEKTLAIRNDLHAIGGHMKNIGKTLMGRKRSESVSKNPDNGFLSSVQKGYLACGRIFSNMERHTKALSKEVERFCNGGGKTISVKEELMRIKSGQSTKSSIQPAVQEKGR